jgi:3-hydroxyethyl bacteriochlorophyllide a dehydrogenase
LTQEGPEIVNATAVILTGPKAIEVQTLALNAAGPSDITVRIAHSGISTGTEKLFWSGNMPPFPGMGYPLVPGYEAAGEVIEAGASSGFCVGDHVFVPGANCYGDVKGLFGGASNMLVSDGSRAVKIDAGMGAEGALLALAATARHAICAPVATLPDLIVGHGVFGRLLARICMAHGKTPTVWEVNADRMGGATGYQVIHPDDDTRHDYPVVIDASGNGDLLNSFVSRIAKGGEVVLAGFYPAPLTFSFPPAFMKEARFRIAAEWTRDDLVETNALIDSGALSLAGLITHTAKPRDAVHAYQIAFEDPSCLKMILNWET